MVGDGPGGDERDDGGAERLLAELGSSLSAEVVAAVPRWVVVQVERILDAWDGTGTDRSAVRSDAEEAGRLAAADVAVRLAALVAADVDAQSSTPLEVMRGAVAYPTAVLRRAGVPAVVRDSFAEARFPDDVYGLSPASLGAVDASLTAPGLAWGAAKAMAHRARHGVPRD